MTFIKEMTCSISQRMCFSSKHCIFCSTASYETESGIVVVDGEQNKKLK